MMRLWPPPERRALSGTACATTSPRNTFRRCRWGERGFFYHSNEGKAVIGIVEVIRAYYPDPSDASGRFGTVDLKAVERLPEPVTLEAVRSQPGLADMALIRNSRLSVQPVSETEWDIVCRMGGLG